jgi:hypothetical protein
MIDPKSNIDVLEADDVVPEARPNRDPITGTPGSHPMGVGVGAATAGAVGGVIGSAIPVVGTLIGVAVGTAVGAVVGGYAGKGAAEVLFPTEEEHYWRERHLSTAENVLGAPYTFDQDYLAAYRFGYINSYAYGTKAFDEAEDELHSAWEESRDASRLSWREAREPSRLAWDRARANQQRASELDGKR